MAQNIYESEKFIVTEYSAGEIYGRSLQIMMRGNLEYVANISQEDAILLADVLYGWATGASIL